MADAAYVPGALLSPSQLTTYLKCPRQWAYRYVSGIRSPSSWAMVQGSAADAVFNEMGVAEMLGLPVPSSAVLAKSARAKVEDVLKQDGVQGDGSVDECLEKALRAVDVYRTFRQSQGFGKLLGVQKHVLFSIEEQPFQGYIDALYEMPDGGTTVVDYKVRGRAPADNAAQTSLQLRCYDVAVNDPQHHVVMLNFIPLKTKTNIVALSHYVSQGERDDLKRQVRRVVRGIARREYPQCPPDSPLCSPAYCGYWGICRGAQSGQPLPIEGEEV